MRILVKIVRLFRLLMKPKPIGWQCGHGPVEGDDPTKLPKDWADRPRPRPDHSRGGRLCGDCAYTREVASLETVSTCSAYLSESKKHIMTWRGRPLAKVTDSRSLIVEGGGIRSSPYVIHLWATDVHGQAWFGEGSVAGEEVKMRRIKDINPSHSLTIRRAEQRAVSEFEESQMEGVEE